MSKNPDLAIARAATLKPITEIAAGLEIEADQLIPFGHTKAKLSGEFLHSLDDRPDGKLVLVTAVTPTPAGEGKTTTSVGLHDGLCRIGEKSIVCLREPSLGPCFGMKGGAAGGGHAQVVPMEDINLHFTGDLHAITAAHNLLSAMIDNHIHWGNALEIDTRRVEWPRVMDLNDRALRDVIVGLGGSTGGYARETRFDITVASEIMAILCLAEDAADLSRRIDRIVVARNRDGEAITTADIKATGAMAVLLKDAILPNLVQTLENNPAFVHGGPFANIAHGCSSVAATRAALKLGDFVVTEAGFGADLGAEKFFDIKCRQANLHPDAVVVVATVRALKYHGGAELKELGEENVEAVRAGCCNLGRHLKNVSSFGVPAVVAINRFVGDTEAEVAAIVEVASKFGVEVVPCTHWSDGGAGTEALARKVAEITSSDSADFSLLYPDDLPLWEKIETIATQIYGASEVLAKGAVRKRIDYLQKKHGKLPVCMAKTPASFSTDPTLRGAPEGHTVRISEVRLSAGAGFIVVICGDLMTMPGLPRVPSAESIRLNDQGQVEGLS